MNRRKLSLAIYLGIPEKASPMEWGDPVHFSADALKNSPAENEK